MTDDLEWKMTGMLPVFGFLFLDRGWEDDHGWPTLLVFSCQNHASHDISVGSMQLAYCRTWKCCINQFMHQSLSAEFSFKEAAFFGKRTVIYGSFTCHLRVIKWFDKGFRFCRLSLCHVVWPPHRVWENKKSSFHIWKIHRLNGDMCSTWGTPRSAWKSLSIVNHLWPGSAAGRRYLVAHFLAWFRDCVLTASIEPTGLLKEVFNNKIRLSPKR